MSFGDSKLTLKDLIMVASVISTALAILLWAQAEFANAENFRNFKDYSQKEFIEIRMERVVMQLNSISAREKLGMASKYDLIRKEELEREYDMLKEQKNAK